MVKRVLRGADDGGLTINVVRARSCANAGASRSEFGQFTAKQRQTNTHERPAQRTVHCRGGGSCRPKNVIAEREKQPTPTKISYTDPRRLSQTKGRRTCMHVRTEGHSRPSSAGISHDLAATSALYRHAAVPLSGPLIGRLTIYIHSTFDILLHAPYALTPCRKRSPNGPLPTRCRVAIRNSTSVMFRFAICPTSLDPTTTFRLHLLSMHPRPVVHPLSPSARQSNISASAHPTMRR